jgi:hypothetical protein
MKRSYLGKPGWFVLHAVAIAFAFWLGHWVRFAP